MRHSIRYAVAIAACVVSAGLGLQPAMAAAPTDAEVSAALERVTAGQEAPGDREIIASVPGLAEQVIDPTKTEVNETPGDGTDEGDGVLPGSKCSRADRYTVYRSLSGARHFDWHMWTRWCYRKGQIVGPPTYGDYVARYDGWTVNLKDPIRKSVEYGPNRVNADVDLQGHVQICIVKYGCYGNYYPHTRYHLGNNGSYQIQQWK